jgi:hypothetical protein
MLFSCSTLNFKRTRMTNELYAEVSFYIVAHADDWQLFMQPNAYKDLVASGHKVVFIITTAGDAGNEVQYWRAREEGCKSSIRFCLAPLSALAESAGTRKCNHHEIYYWAANNAICYFLRLPDGNIDGSGFSKYNYQSLPKFSNGIINSITAIDNSTTYRDWTDLCNTLQTIIQTESGGISISCINYQNPCISANPNDHADHIATGQAIQAIGNLSHVPQALFAGYNSGNETTMMNETEYFWKAGMFAAYEKAVLDGSGYSTLKEDIPTYLRWCARGANFITKQ